MEKMGIAMYGTHSSPVVLEKDNIRIELSSNDDQVSYIRDCNDSHEEKDLYLKKAQFFIEPVEPMHLPEKLTPYLMIELEKNIVIEPKNRLKIHLSFPVEIASYIKLKKEVRRIDVFSQSVKKYTLYGDPEEGVLCKYWKSIIHEDISQLDPLKEGVLELQIENTTSEWCEINCAVFNAYGMKIFYDEEMVSLVASMKIKDDFLAETQFENKPLKKGMTKSFEMFLPGKLSVGSSRFSMEYGLCLT